MLRVNDAGASKETAKSSASGVVSDVRRNGVDPNAGIDDVYRRGLDLGLGKSFVSVTSKLQNDMRYPLRQDISAGELSASVSTRVDVRSGKATVSAVWSGDDTPQLRAHSFRGTLGFVFDMPANDPRLVTLTKRFLSERADYINGKPVTLSLSVKE